MGITIHYNGRLNAKKSLPLLIEEVKDIAEVSQWNYEIYRSGFPKNHFGKKTHNNTLYGMCFTPPGCETVSLTFLSNGTLVS